MKFDMRTQDSETTTNYKSRNASSSVIPDINIQRENCFCCSKFDFYRVSTLTVFMSDCVLFIVQIYYIFQFSFDTQTSDFQQSFIDGYDNVSKKRRDETLSHLENHFVIITFPLTVFLFFKLLKGVRWIRQGFTRPALSTYFLYSMSFYFSFITQMFFTILFTWNVFNNEVRGLIVFELCISLPFLVLLQMHMNYEDRKSKDMNILRKEVQEQMALRNTQYSRDTKVISEYQRRLSQMSSNFLMNS